MTTADTNSTAGQLVTACGKGDLATVQALVAAGASVNETGFTKGWPREILPLFGAVLNKQGDVVVWLLTAGAMVHGDVMIAAATFGSPDTFQLLIDAGGATISELLAHVVAWRAVTMLPLLVTHPGLDLRQSDEVYAHSRNMPEMADMIAQEVWCAVRSAAAFCVLCLVCVCVCPEYCCCLVMVSCGWAACTTNELGTS